MPEVWCHEHGDRSMQSRLECLEPPKKRPSASASVVVVVVAALLGGVNGTVSVATHSSVVFHVSFVFGCV